MLIILSSFIFAGFLPVNGLTDFQGGICRSFGCADYGLKKNQPACLARIQDSGFRQ